MLLEIKTTAAEQLKLMSMNVQQHLLNWDELNHDQLKLGIEKYEKALKDMKAHRISITKILDDKKAELMQPEKELEIAESYLKAIEKERKFRLDEEVKQKAAYNKQKEVADFKTHFVNEFHRIAGEYRTELKRTISGFYIACLEASTPEPNIEQLNTMLDGIELGKPNPYTIVFNERAAMAEVYNAIPKINKAEIRAEANNWIKEKFELYQQDLAAKDLVIQQEVMIIEAAEIEIKESVQNAQATNILLASAEIVEVKPLVKRKKRLKLEAQNTMHVVAVMSAFIQHFQKVMPKLRVKDYTKLNIQQMADALDKCEIELTNMQYEEYVD